MDPAVVKDIPRWDRIDAIRRSVVLTKNELPVLAFVGAASPAGQQVSAACPRSQGAAPDPCCGCLCVELAMQKAVPSITGECVFDFHHPAPSDTYFTSQSPQLLAALIHQRLASHFGFL
jgi:hypothetical protein